VVPLNAYHGRIETLGPAECLALLSGAQLGRVGVTVDALPTIFPVIYRWVGGQVLFLTAEGTKLTAALREAVVAFEVDEVDTVAQTGWSVQAVGIARARVLTTDGMAADLVDLPWAFGDRRYLVALRPERISGRRLMAPDHWALERAQMLTPPSVA
jgi:uncharacterized protein